MKRLILNADDLGYDPAVTRGILESMRNGVVTSATLMVNLPNSREAAQAAAGLAIGLHLNLARGAPASGGFPAALLDRGGFVEARAASLPADAVERETLAQLDLAESLLGRPATHVDVHKHLHQHPEVLAGACAAARARGVPVRAITSQMRAAVRSLGAKTTDHFIGDAGATAYWTLEQLAADILRLEDGVTELMCHPGYAPTTLQSGYSHQREVELATFTSPLARELLDHAGIERCDFRAVR
jgi:predicted glycoside hydrolase/deacetylase ChbG (UPF0249 family)